MDRIWIRIWMRIRNTDFISEPLGKNCWLILDVETEVEKRMIKHSDGGYSCCVCNYFSLHSSTLKCHIESKHLQTTGYFCQICNKFCPTRNALKCHKYRLHSKKGQWRSILLNSFFVLISISCFSPLTFLLSSMPRLSLSLFRYELPDSQSDY